MTCFTNGEGESWQDVADTVHGFMCPDTGRSCHSLCMCYAAEETASGETRKAYAEAGYPCHVATCIKYDVKVYE